MVSLDEVRDPRQVWARRTWVADRGVRCDRAHSLDKFSVAPLRLAHAEIGSVLSGPYLSWVADIILGYYGEGHTMLYILSPESVLSLSYAILPTKCWFISFIFAESLYWVMATFWFHMLTAPCRTQIVHLRKSFWVAALFKPFYFFVSLIGLLGRINELS